MKDWIRQAFLPSVMRRSIGYAVVVGAILVTINHGPAILHGEVTGQRIFQMCLTVMVPYTVSTLSSVGAIRKLRSEAAASASAQVK